MSGAWDTESTSIIQLNTRNNSKHTLSLSFFTIFFKVCGFDKKISNIYRSTHMFFTYIVLFCFVFFGIDICYGSLSQFVLRHHTGERGRRVKAKIQSRTEGQRRWRLLES